MEQIMKNKLQDKRIRRMNSAK